MIYVISDLHGYPHERFLQLLEKASFGKNDFLYILGDVVDRNGDGGVETLEWLMYQTNVQLILGNHEAMLLAKETQQDILDYLRDCPLYETVSAGGRDFILVHSGFENFDPKKRIEDYADDELLWAWPELTDVYYKSVTTVFGHTPTLAFGDEYEEKIIKTDTWIDIDMGAGFGREPVLLRLDDMKEYRLSS